MIAKHTEKNRLMAARETSDSRPSRRLTLHPLLIRLMHWTNAFAMLLMVTSGWKIYNDSALFGWLHFADAITLGIWAQHALQWHFAAMWLLVVNGLAYLIYGVSTGRFRRMLLPIRLRDVLREMIEALSLRMKHADLTHYNAVQKLLYVGVILVIIVQVITGLAIWKPVQFQSLVFLCGGFQGARLAHFLGMTAIVVFVLVHVTLAFLVPKTLLAMLTGGPKVDVNGAPHRTARPH